PAILHSFPTRRSSDLFLKRVSLQPDEIKIIAYAVDTLDHYESGMQWGVEFMKAVRRLQALRNKIAHGQADEPRSAYSLHDDDNADRKSTRLNSSHEWT